MPERQCTNCLFPIAATLASERVYFGVTLLELTQEIADQYGSGDVSRVRHGTIIEVANWSPAKQAGLRTGDVLVTLDDQPISQPIDVVRVVQDSEPGDDYSAKIVRHGVAMTVVGKYVAFSELQVECPSN